MSVGGRGDIDRFLRGARDLRRKNCWSGTLLTHEVILWLAQGLAEVLIRREDYTEARDVLRYHSEHAGVACTLASLEIQIDGVEGLEPARSLLEQLTLSQLPCKGDLQRWMQLQELAKGLWRF